MIQQSNPIDPRKFILTSAFRLSSIWDLVTTFLGILLILNKVDLIPIGIALTGTLIVVAFNFSTKTIWERRNTKRTKWRFPNHLLKVAWGMAIVVDLWTSLTCNAWFISSQQAQDKSALLKLLQELTSGQFIIVLFVTVLTVISPMMISYIREQDAELPEQALTPGPSAKFGRRE